MTGPSAIGSENGTPSSMTSAPAAASACITGTVASSDGSPAVTNGTRALRPWALSEAKRELMRFIGIFLFLIEPLSRLRERGLGEGLFAQKAPSSAPAGTFSRGREKGKPTAPSP